MFDWLAANLWMVWLVVAGVLAITEVTTLDFTLLMLASGALAGAGTPLLFAEQNNGYLWSKAVRTLFDAGRGFDPARMKAVNLLDKGGKPRFVHSGTYKELTAAYGLGADGMLDAVRSMLG